MRRWQLEVAAGWVEELGTETEMQMTFWKVVKEKGKLASWISWRKKKKQGYPPHPYVVASSCDQTPNGHLEGGRATLDDRAQSSVVVAGRGRIGLPHISGEVGRTDRHKPNAPNGLLPPEGPNSQRLPRLPKGSHQLGNT